MKWSLKTDFQTEGTFTFNGLLDNLPLCRNNQLFRGPVNSNEGGSQDGFGVHRGAVPRKAGSVH